MVDKTDIKSVNKSDEIRKLASAMKEELGAREVACARTPPKSTRCS